MCLYAEQIWGLFATFERKQVLNDADITAPICTLFTQYKSKHTAFFPKDLFIYLEQREGLGGEQES